MGLLAGEQVLGRREVVEPEGAELPLGVRLGLAELRLHLGAAAQPAVDLDVAQLGSASSELRRSQQRDEGEDEADDGDDAADDRGIDARG